MIDRAAIDAAWDRVAHQLDPVHGDAEADALLRDHATERPGIECAIEHIELVNTTDGGAIDALGYGFAHDPLVWRRASEAVYQARALQQLGHWCSINQADSPALVNVVLRQTFATSFAFGTPRHVVDAVAEPIHFVVVPFAYAELLMLSAKTLNALIAGDEASDAWAVLSATVSDAAAPPPAMRQLLARLLTDHAFHASEPGDNPTAILQAHSTWFEYDEGDRAPGALETHLSYAALDFAIAHEIGHRILHHLAPDTPGGLLLEEGADLVGLRLFAASWGWRDDVFEGCPLSDGGRVLLGPIWFFHSASVLLTLQRLLGERLHAVAPTAPLAKARHKPARHLATVVERWSRQKAILAQYAEIADAHGAISDGRDAEVLRRLAAALDALARALPRWVEQIPEEDLRFCAAMRAI